MRHRLHHNKAGFTLVELLVTIVIITILSLAIMNFVGIWLQDSSIARARAALLQNAQTALDTANKDIMQSGSADQNNRYPDAYAPGAPSNTLSWASSSNTLVLAEAAEDSSGHIIFSDPNKYIPQKDNSIYFVSNKTLYRRTLSSGTSGDATVTTCPAAHATSSCPADKVIATGVTNFSVQYYDASEAQVTPTNARSVQLSLSLQQTYGGQTLTASYSTRMVFRND